MRSVGGKGFPRVALHGGPLTEVLGQLLSFCMFYRAQRH